MIAICVAALVNLLIAAAVELVWVRRREAAHARNWTAAFLLIAAGWAVRAWTDTLGHAGAPNAAMSLCWLAAGLLLVHGLRQRSARPNRADVLATIWMAVAAAVALLLDLGGGALAVAAVPLLVALGLMLAAFAVAPRGRGTPRLDLAATLLLFGAAFTELGLAWLRLSSPRAAMALFDLAPLLGIPFYVALGLVAMLLLNDDLTIALDRLARTDPLTGIWNRRGFEEGAASLLERLRARDGRLASVAIADIDSFKAINDRFGHHAGDTALVRFARQLRCVVQPGDLLARLGGEEFALLAIGVDGPTLVERVERARLRVALPDEQSPVPVQITASFGVAQLDPHSLVLREALEHADHAMLRAKKGGKNRTYLADPSLGD